MPHKGIACPTCGSTDQKVLHSDPVTRAQRRRRECAAGHRFTTYEMVVTEHPRVIRLGPGGALATADLELVKVRLLQRVQAAIETAL